MRLSQLQILKLCLLKKTNWKEEKLQNKKEFLTINNIAFISITRLKTITGKKTKLK